MNFAQIEIPQTQLYEFCQRWKITELSLFGSVLREDFRPDSDIDILVNFTQDNQWTLLDHVTMQDELEKILKRKVDLLNKSAIRKSENYIRRQNILNSAKVIYAIS